MQFVARKNLHAVAARLLATIILAPLPANASDTDPEICQRAKALGYDESKELLKFSSKRELCTLRFWNLFQPKPLEQVLDAAELTRYHHAIAQRNCSRALTLLSDNFAAAHPDAPPHLSGELKGLNWRTSMSRHYYPSLGLCQDLRSIRRALRDVTEAGLEFRPFWSRRENFYQTLQRFPKPVRRVYSGVGRLIHSLARTRSPKVALALLRLSDDGKAIKLHPQYELYIALRLHRHGLTDTLIDKIIRRPIDPLVRANIADKAKRATPHGLSMFPN